MPVLEDAAQAAGSTAPSGRPGALGTAATFSFFPSKNLGCFGDGGMITTSDAALAERVRTLRFHGSRDKVTYEQVGYNSRLDELQAAILRVQLPHLDALADGRRRAGRHYEEAGLGELVTLPVRRRGTLARRGTCTWSSHPEVERLEAALAAAGIGHKPYYRTPVHRQAPMREWGAGRRAARHRAGRPHAPGDPDEPGADARAGRGGRGAAPLGAAALARPQRQRSSRSSSPTSRTTRAGTPITTRARGHVARDDRAGRHERLLADLDARREHGAAADPAGAPQRSAPRDGHLGRVARHRVVVAS